MKPSLRKAKQLELFGRTVEASQWRADLLRRLDDEGATDLADRLRKCGLAFRLYCQECGLPHEAEVKCNRKWCPSCAPKRANERVEKLRAAARRMQWPLHITLTCKNVDLAEAPRTLLRNLMKAFRTLRRSKLWKTNVVGGVVSVEITDKGKGLHPHLHALVDCRWLSLETPEPTSRDSPEKIRHKFRSAATELSGTWARCLQQEEPPSIFIRRCDAGAAAEIIKYALKSEDVQNSQGLIAPILRMLDAVRTVATFGSLHGLKVDAEDDYKLTCPNGHSSWSTTPAPGTQYADLSQKAKLRALLAGRVRGL